MTIIDRPLEFAKRHRDVVILILFALTMIAAGLSFNQSMNASDQAHTAAISSGKTADAAKNQAAVDAKRIDTLFFERDTRQYGAEVARYRSALVQCRLQNQARQGTNEIIDILQDAFQPAAAAERAGVKQTPVVHRLIPSVASLKKIPLTRCLKVLVNPDAKPTHK